MNKIKYKIINDSLLNIFTGTVKAQINDNDFKSKLNIESVGISTTLV